MKKSSLVVTIFVTYLFIWIASAATNESIAGGHYRIGTLNESLHYRDSKDLNSSHDGIYIVYENNVFGTYYNSEFEQSLFYMRNNRINNTFSFSYGLATGYEFGTVPMIGLSAQLNIFKLTFTPEAAVLGLEFQMF
jgi:hypothetical protein